MEARLDTETISADLFTYSKHFAFIQSLFAQAPVGVAIFLGPDLVCQTANEAYLALVDLKKEELIGKTIFDALPEIKQQMLPIAQKLMTTGESFAAREYVVELHRKGKSHYGYFNFVWEPLRNTNGTIAGIIAIATDVTDQVENRKKIEESEQRFQAAIAEVQGVLWTNNATGQMTGEQPGWAALTGQSFAEYQGYGWAQAVHPEDAQPTIDAWNEAVRERKMFVFEHRLKLKDGSWGIFSIQAVPVFQDDGSIREWVGVHTNISEQRKAEASLRQSEEQFRQLAETLSQLVWITDAAGNRLYASSRWEEYTGIALGPNSWVSIVHPNDLPGINKAWNESLQKGLHYKIQVRLKNKNGAYRWHYGQGEPLRDENGVIVKWIGSFTDIHDQKTLAEQLEHLVAERTKELHRSNEDLQQFAHVASHDLKEPVRKVRTFVSRLSSEFKEELPPKAKEYIDKIDSAAQRMYAMIDGVLLYSTLNGVEQSFEMVDLNDTIRNIELDLEVLVQRQKAVISYSHLPTIYGAPLLIYQLFYNLINNSIKFAKADVVPQISITYMQTEEAFMITVSDNGIGFDPADKQQIFKPFSRLHSKEKYDGIGLGLALCQKIVERHKGTIKANGDKGMGASFVIRLPINH
ncbi:MAG: hypothetical protein C4329_10255 [Chitinophagaceae bacterium]